MPYCGVCHRRTRTNHAHAKDVSVSYSELAEAYHIRKKTEIIHTLLGRKIICNSCGKKVKVHKSSKFRWKFSHGKGNEPDEIYTYTIANHNFGLLKGKCRASGKRFRYNEGSRW
ncbi:MAG: hypothetical protein ACYDAJ_11745 [Nitrosotalea sp.]